MQVPLVPLLLLLGGSALAAPSGLEAASRDITSSPLGISKRSIDLILPILYGLGNASEAVPTECTSSCSPFFADASSCTSTFNADQATTTTVTTLESCLCASMITTDTSTCTDCILGDSSISQTMLSTFTSYYNMAFEGCVSDGYLQATGTDTFSGGSPTGTAVFTGAGTTKPTATATGVLTQLNGATATGGGATQLAGPTAAGASPTATVAGQVKPGAAGKLEIGEIVLIAALVGGIVGLAL
ncbi:hypothetical protein T439DRAFT_222265 [Meredithblackwellia eburnea MCA 4105]